MEVEMGKRFTRVAAVLCFLLLIALEAGQDLKVRAVERRGEMDSPANMEIFEDQTNEIAESIDGIEHYYGTYQIIEFWPNISYRALRFDRLREQEADMLLGRIVEIKEDLLVSWDCFIGLGTRTGRLAFPGNYSVEKFSVEASRYEWEALDPDSRWYEEYEYPRILDDINEEYYQAIEGRIRIQIPDAGRCWQDFFVMENGIIMYSSMHCQFFYLARVDIEPVETERAGYLTEVEKRRVLQNSYGTYTIVEFLPTKFYPALDSAGDILLPQEEADMMVGKEIVIGEDLYVTYDNLRLPNSEFRGRAMDEFCLETIEIPEPDYQIQEKLRDDIFGLRDEMLSGEMEQEKYIEISVYPGYGSMDKTLPQLYLLEDGRMIMYAMGEYFLIEQKSDRESEMSVQDENGSQEDLSDLEVQPSEVFEEGGSRCQG